MSHKKNYQPKSPAARLIWEIAAGNGNPVVIEKAREIARHLERPILEAYRLHQIEQQRQVFQAWLEEKGSELREVLLTLVATDHPKSPQENVDRLLEPLFVNGNYTIRPGVVTLMHGMTKLEFLIRRDRVSGVHALEDLVSEDPYAWMWSIPDISSQTADFAIFNGFPKVSKIPSELMPPIWSGDLEFPGEEHQPSTDEQIGEKAFEIIRSL